MDFEKIHDDNVLVVKKIVDYFTTGERGLTNLVISLSYIVVNRCLFI